MLDAFANNWTILVISFFIYSFCGWIWESLICPIATSHKIHNSGFLTGPCIPIYGSGAIGLLSLQKERLLHALQNISHLILWKRCSMQDGGIILK